MQIITALSGISVVLSLLFVARQTRELTRQTRLNNRIGTLGSMHDSLEMLHEIQAIFTDRPELRPYFYGGKPCPRRGHRREMLVNIAEMLADTIDYGLMVVKLMPGTEEYEGWLNYALFMMQSSPALREHVDENPDWYLAYRRIIVRHSQHAAGQRGLAETHDSSL
jgi:hypothetical protein